MRVRLILAGVGVLLSALPGALGADNRLAMRVSPAFAFAPADLVVQTIIEASAENRAVEIVAESESFYRSSESQLDGDRAPRTSTFQFRNVPGGTYQVTATLFGAGGEALRSVRREVNVLPGGGK